MSISKNSIRMALAVAMIVGPLPAKADGGMVSQGGGGSSQIVTFRVCNKTSHNALVGYSYIARGENRWTNKGWKYVSPNDCQDMFVTDNRTFYARAEVQGDSSSYWGSDIQQCVEYPGPYEFYTSDEDTTCPEGEPAEFTTFHSDGRPIYVWNLTN